MKLLAILPAFILIVISCSKDEGIDPNRQPDTSYNPQLDVSDFTNSAQLTNPYFSFEVGKKYLYEGQTEDGLEHIEVELLTTTRNVMGITCAIIHDKVWVDGKLIEDTRDWYAQDNHGLVWYMGEDVDNYNSNGELINHNGAWQAGIDGAKPGIIMLADPQPGMQYRQEYYFNHAEDQAEVVATNIPLQIGFGIFEKCLQTKEWTELEKDVLEYKFYAPGFGVVKEMNVTDNEEIVLIGIK